MLLLKLFLVPCFIGVIALCGRFWGASIAGILSGLPIIAGPIIWFVYLENGFEFAQNAAIATVGGIFSLSSFCFSYSWFCTKHEWKTSLFISSILYFSVAILVSNINLGLNKSAFIVLSAILLQLYFSPKIEQKLLLAPASALEILYRMSFALILVFLITTFAVSLGKIYSGVLAAFPIAGSTIAIFSHRNLSSAHAIRSLKSMIQGLLSMLAFFYVASVTSTEVGFSAALLFGAIVALLLQVTIFYVKNYNKVIKRMVFK